MVIGKSYFNFPIMVIRSTETSNVKTTGKVTILN